jgi:hypothetical protein
MVATAVGLDHEALLRPEEVDLQDALRGADAGIDLRERQSRRRDQGQGLRLEEAPDGRVLRRFRNGPPFVDDATEAGTPRRRGPFASTASIAARSRTSFTTAISIVSRNPFFP